MIVLSHPKEQVLGCMGHSGSTGSFCHTLIGIRLDIGPAAFRCPACGCYYIVDPLTAGEASLEIEGHHIEVLQPEPNTSSEDASIRGLVIAKIGDPERIYSANVHSRPGGGLETVLSLLD